jgi:quinol monooxygenase YgiN
MALFIFARFHAAPGQEQALAAAMREVVSPTSQEPGCVSIGAFRSTQDPRLFYIHSRWVDEAAFEHHGTLPHTTRFLEQAQSLVDQPFEVARTQQFA